MKESYVEDVANHSGLESCVDDPRGRSEALTEVCAGGLLSSEITQSLMPTRLSAGEGNIVCTAIARCIRIRRSRRTWHAQKLSARKSGDPVSSPSRWQAAGGWYQ